MPQNDRYLYHELPALLATTLKMSQAADALEKGLKRNTPQEIDGIYKQIYVGFDIPVPDKNQFSSIQPIINDILSYLDDS